MFVYDAFEKELPKFVCFGITYCEDTSLLRNFLNRFFTNSEHYLFVFEVLEGQFTYIVDYEIMSNHHCAPSLEQSHFKVHFRRAYLKRQEVPFVVEQFGTLGGFEAYIFACFYFMFSAAKNSYSFL